MNIKLKNFFISIKNKVLGFFAVRVNVYVFIILLVGILLRIVKFGSTPIGLNQDEAFAGYEAFSLANYGVDSAGYHNPVYFVSWGSGMNVLETYLAIPFVKIFGLSVYTIRLPQLICAIISLPIAYHLILIITKDRHLALLTLFLLAISPWHIMLSRWGLESNLAPAFLLFGLYFFVRGIKQNYMFIFSAIFYGLTLYSYAITWAIVPFIVAGGGLYLLLTRTKFLWRYIIISVTVLFVFALPLILFVFINNGTLPEIKTRVISIPKMLVMRDSEIKLSNLTEPESYKDLFDIIFKQEDGHEHNSTEFGLFYKISIPFMIVGFTVLVGDFIKSVRQKKLELKSFLLISLICSLLGALMLNGKNINRVNAIHINLLFLVAIGLNSLFKYFKDTKALKRVFIVGYCVSLAYFCSFYFGNYNEDIKDNFRYGAQEAIEYVNEQNFESVNVDYHMYYPTLLFYDKTPTDEFLETVKYNNYPSEFLSAKSFTKYTFGIDVNGSYDAYILHNTQSWKDTFEHRGFTIIEFGEFAVAQK